MKIKYFGTSWEAGLTLTGIIYNMNAEEIDSYPLTETAVNSAIYSSDDILLTLPKGVYVTMIVDDESERLGYNEFIWDGSKEISLNDIHNWTIQEQMEIRDALGMTGDKSVAMGGQLQKKSEYPHNSVIDTNNIENN